MAAPNSDVAGSTQPRFPEYANFQQRYHTFVEFPRHLDHLRRPLAKAGFFYNGQGDSVMCFFCGGSLGRWQPDDDPWIEHARWYHDCPYVMREEGQTFIDMIRENLLLVRQSTISNIQTGDTGDSQQQERRPHWITVYPREGTMYHTNTPARERTGEKPDKIDRSGDVAAANSTTADDLQYYLGLRDQNREPNGRIISGQPNKNTQWPQNVFQPSVEIVAPPCDRLATPPSNRLVTQLSNRLVTQPSDAQTDINTQTETYQILPSQIQPTVRPTQNNRTYTPTTVDQIEGAYGNSEPPTEPQGATAKFHSEEPTASGVSGSCKTEPEDRRESDAVLSVKSMGYSDEIIEASIKQLQTKNKNVTGISIMEEIIEMEEAYKEPENRPESPAVLSVEAMGYSDLRESLRLLQDKIKAVEEQNRILKKEMTCKVCLERTVEIVFQPCGHLCCSECAQNSSIVKCPLCRVQIEKKDQKIFLS